MSRSALFVSVFVVGVGCAETSAVVNPGTGGSISAGGSSGAMSGGSGGSGGVGGESAGNCPTTLPPDCPTPTPGARQPVTSVAAGTYLLRHPTTATEQTDVVVFLPGGPGTENTATITWDNWLSQGDAIDSFLVVMPFATDGSLLDEYPRAVTVLDEVQRCYCQSGRAHLAGTSNGGVGAFTLMLSAGPRFASLLGAPGVFQPFDANAVAAALANKAVFNGAGEIDDAWRPNVESTHQSLLDLGIDSTLSIFPGEGHILTPGFDESVFFAWWATK